MDESGDDDDEKKQTKDKDAQGQDSSSDGEHETPPAMSKKKNKAMASKKRPNEVADSDDGQDDEMPTKKKNKHSDQSADGWRTIALPPKNTAQENQTEFETSYYHRSRPQWILVARRSNGDAAIVDEDSLARRRCTNDEEVLSSLAGYGFSDRLLYQAGETVHLRGVVRRVYRHQHWQPEFPSMRLGQQEAASTELDSSSATHKERATVSKEHQPGTEKSVVDVSDDKKRDMDISDDKKADMDVSDDKKADSVSDDKKERGLKLNYTLRAGGRYSEEIVAQGSAWLNRFGCLDVDIKLPAVVRTLGEASLEIVSARADQPLRFDVPIRIEEFRRPEFEISLAPVAGTSHAFKYNSEVCWDECVETDKITCYAWVNVSRHSINSVCLLASLQQNPNCTLK